MTLPQLERRTIFYMAKDGVQQSIDIQIEFGPEEFVDLGEGETIKQLRAHAYVTSPIMNSKLQAIGFDCLQTLARLMNVTDIWIQKVCKDNEVTLFTIVPDLPVAGSFGVFM